jgi:hypothetical protein
MKNLFTKICTTISEKLPEKRQYMMGLIREATDYVNFPLSMMMCDVVSSYWEVLTEEEQRDYIIIAVDNVAIA